MAVMVLFRDRFRLVAPIYRNRPFTFVQRHFGDVHPKCAYGTCTSPRSGTKFAHALIKYRLSQMSLHRIHHPTQKAVHDPRKAPLSSPRPKPTRALWLVFQLFPKLACFPIASGWGSFLISQIFPQPACFPAASGWGIFPVFQLFTQPACFPVASGWGIFLVSQLSPHPLASLNSKNARFASGRFQTYISNYSNSTLSLLVYPCPYSSAPELPVHHHSLHHS